MFQAKSVTVSPSSHRAQAYGSCGSELQSITVVYSLDQSVHLSVTFNFTMYSDSTYHMDSFSLEAVINGEMIDGWWILHIFKRYKQSSSVLAHSLITRESCNAALLVFLPVTVEAACPFFGGSSAGGSAGWSFSSGGFV